MSESPVTFTKLKPRGQGEKILGYSIGRSEAWVDTHERRLKEELELLRERHEEEVETLHGRHEEQVEIVRGRQKEEADYVRDTMDQEHEKRRTTLYAMIDARAEIKQLEIEVKSQRDLVTGLRKVTAHCGDCKKKADKVVEDVQAKFKREREHSPLSPWSGGFGSDFDNHDYYNPLDLNQTTKRKASVTSLSSNPEHKSQKLSPDTEVALAEDGMPVSRAGGSMPQTSSDLSTQDNSGNWLNRPARRSGGCITDLSPEREEENPSRPASIFGGDEVESNDGPNASTNANTSDSAEKATSAKGVVTGTEILKMLKAQKTTTDVGAGSSKAVDSAKTNKLAALKATNAMKKAKKAALKERLAKARANRKSAGSSAGGE